VATNLLNANTWVSLNNAPEVTGDQNTVTLPVEAANGFYRLKQP
jgi:hypothetical protein